MTKKTAAVQAEVVYEEYPLDVALEAIRELVNDNLKGGTTGSTQIVQIQGMTIDATKPTALDYEDEAIHGLHMAEEQLVIFRSEDRKRIGDLIVAEEYGRVIDEIREAFL